MALRVVLAGMLLVAGTAAAAPNPLQEPPTERLGMLVLPPDDPEPPSVGEAVARVQAPVCRVVGDTQGQLGPADGPVQETVAPRACAPGLPDPGLTRPPADPEDPEATLRWAATTVAGAQAEVDALAAEGQGHAETLAGEAQEQAGALASEAQELPGEAQERVERLPDRTAAQAQHHAEAVQEEAERTAEDPQGGVERAAGAAKGLARHAVSFVKDLWPF